MKIKNFGVNSGKGLSMNSKVRISNLLREVNKHARTRKAELEDVLGMSKLVEGLVSGKISDTEISKNTRVEFRNLDNKRGAIFKVNPHAQYFAASYQGIPYSTFLYFGVNEKGKAVLLDASREQCNAAMIQYYASRKLPSELLLEQDELV